jgi:hypothetical protein
MRGLTVIEMQSMRWCPVSNSLIGLRPFSDPNLGRDPPDDPSGYFNEFTKGPEPQLLRKLKQR